MFHKGARSRAMRNLQYMAWCSSHIIRSIAGSDGKLRKVTQLWHRCRDTFTSLKKTCRKLGIGFWQYLEDRVSRKNSIPSLPDLIRLRVRESPG